MSADPDTIITALETFLTNALVPDTLKFVVQKQPPFDQMNEQPIAVLQHVGDDDNWPTDGLHQTALEIEIWVWVQTKNPNGIPASELRKVTSPIRAALAPPAYLERQTLGGLVYDCRIEGRSKHYPSDLGDQGLSILPVNIRLNSTYP